MAVPPRITKTLPEIHDAVLEWQKEFKDDIPGCTDRLRELTDAIKEKKEALEAQKTKAQGKATADFKVAHRQSETKLKLEKQADGTLVGERGVKLIRTELEGLDQIVKCNTRGRMAFRSNGLYSKDFCTSIHPLVAPSRASN